MGDCSPLLALVSVLVMLSEVGTGASMGTWDSNVSIFTALLTVLAVRAGSVGCAMDAEVVIPVGRLAPDVNETPKLDVGTKVA